MTGRNSLSDINQSDLCLSITNTMTDHKVVYKFLFSLNGPCSGPPLLSWLLLMAASPEVKGAVRLKMVLQLVGLQRQLTGTDLDVGGVLYLGVFAASFNN